MASNLALPALRLLLCGLRTTHNGRKRAMRSQIIGVLQDARELVRDDWGSSNDDVDWRDASGFMCASVALMSAAVDEDLCDQAHAAFLAGAGIQFDEGQDARELVYAFNDAQTNRAPVVAAFDRAIAILNGETPSADAALAVMAACDQAGDVLAGYIVSEHPEMDHDEIRTLASAELFYAAQDTAKVCDVAATV